MVKFIVFPLPLLKKSFRSESFLLPFTLVCLVSLLSLKVQAQDGNWLWWEAESFAGSSGLLLQEDRSLSSDSWISLDETRNGQSRYVEYEEITVPESGSYQFYARKYWNHGPFSWSFDTFDEVGTYVSDELGIIDTQTLNSGEVANWVWAGEVFLEKGEHRLRIELERATGPAKFDAFVLTDSAFPFRGQYMPDDSVSVNEAGWFSWHYLPEGYEDNPIDLRYLNEHFAGEHGYIRANGDHFEQEDTGETIRFWGSSVGKEVVRLDNFSMEQLARDMAKYGVNLIRVHFPLYDGRGVDLDEMNYSDLERLHYFVSVMKEQGIYTSLSAYFPLWTRLGPDDDRFPGYEGEVPFSTLFYDSTLQGIYQGWLREMLTTINPYTQVALTDEPAIHSVELVNEDSLLFWSFSDRNIPEQSMDMLEEKFFDWLITSFSSLEEVENRWDGFRWRLDHPRQGRIGFLSLYDMREDRSQRAKDTVQFLTELQLDFFDEHYNYLKAELGFSSMVSASNWITASAEYFGPLDKYSNTVGDFMDRHGYFEPYHESDNDRTSRYSLRPGHRFRDRSSLRFESSGEQPGEAFANPMFDITYDDKPSMISEVNWPMPNRFRAEMPFLQATYARMQGMDAIINFESVASPWLLEQDKFSTHSPVIKGQWPVAALAFRRGDVSEGEVVAEASLPLEGHLFELAGSPVSLQPNLDRFRDNEEPGVVNLSTFHPLNFLRGRVKINFVEQGDASLTYERSSPVNTQQGYALSTNLELLWNYSEGFVTVNTPLLQGVSGFLADVGRFELDNFIIDTEMPYGSVLLISLDGLALSHSMNMLLQVVSEEKPTGWRVVQDGENSIIEELGRSPILIRNLEGRIMIQNENPDLLAKVLDQNGYAISEQAFDGVINLEPNAVYYQISK